MRDQVRQLRCAVYTRKSSEEGLEQDFNSLHAQREACEAYILSQKHEGWRVVPTPYDDGGFSGGSMQRPGLQKLLGDIASGQVDVIAVYKVDRLTRSLTDFARMVEVFDKHGVSFVSVTQAFNTTSSMGRLTLNVLLSFAQFEREVTGERIRDKIAASKKKGLWMGGYVPIGYDVDGRTLKVNEAEAETVRTIYRLYLELGSVDALRGELERRGIRSKERAGRKGAMQGGTLFSRGHLYRMLQNPLYTGKIRHKGVVHDGQHDAIVDRATWDRVQAAMGERSHEHKVRGRARHPSLLADFLYDESGVRLTSTHAVKDGKRYRYYVRRPEPGERARSTWRLPARDVEALVLDQLRTKLTDPQWVATALAPWSPSPDQLRNAFERGDEHALALTGTTPRVRAALLGLVQRVRISGEEVRIEIKPEALLDGGKSQDGRVVEIVCRAPLWRTQGANRIVLPMRAGPEKLPHASLVKAIARGHVWFEELISGRAETITQIAGKEGVTDRYVSSLLPLALIDPVLVQRCLSGEVAVRDLPARDQSEPDRVLWHDRTGSSRAVSRGVALRSARRD